MGEYAVDWWLQADDDNEPANETTGFDTNGGSAHYVDEYQSAEDEFVQSPPPQYPQAINPDDLEDEDVESPAAPNDDAASIPEQPAPAPADS